MPLPKPKKQETKDDFIDRCMGDDSMNEEYPDTDQRRAVCENQWGGKKKKGSSLVGAIQGTLPALLEYATTQAWAMEVNILQQAAHVVERHFSGERLLAEEIAAITAPGNNAEQKPGYEVTADHRAIIRVEGIIAKHSRMVNGQNQPRGTALEGLNDQLDEAMADRHVQSILLHIESPGGSIDGLPDFAGKVYEASFEKPVVAFIDDMGASAAYWIASQANAIYATQAAAVGSIGVYTLYMDSSAWAEKKGLKFHILRSGANKGVGEMGIAISEENLAAIQERINTYFEIFVGAVMRGRVGAGLNEQSLRGLADGRTYVGRTAMLNNLIDGVGTFAEVMQARLPALRNIAKVTAGASAQVNNNQFKEQNMDTRTAGADAVAAATPGAEQLKAAADTERQRIIAIGQVLAGDIFEKVRNKAIAESLSLTEAKALAFDAAIEAHKGEIAGLKAQIADRDQKLKAILDGSTVRAAEPSDADEEKGTAAGDNGKAETYEAAVKELVAAGKKKGQAGIEAAGKFPQSHEAWKKAHAVAYK